MEQTILVVGGAGYIGSHTAYELHRQGHRVIVLDALLHGQTCAHPWATFIRGDFGDKRLLRKLFAQYTIDAVMHFAAHIEVGRSVTDPLTFYRNNVGHTLTLLEVMRAYQCDTMIFSSSCAVYGNPEYTPIDEAHPKHPMSPYGTTKLMVEKILADCAHAYGLRYVALRYFNVAGAHHEQDLREQHVPETHLIPLLCKAACEQTPFSIFGTTHTTPDGGCIRDFLHVRDIADAHVKSLAYLHAGNPSTSFNLGTGTGVSVLEMIVRVERLTGTNIPIVLAAPRLGDPAILVANAAKAHTYLHWQPQFSDITRIITDTLASMKNTHPEAPVQRIGRQFQE